MSTQLTLSNVTITPPLGELSEALKQYQEVSSLLILLENLGRVNKNLPEELTDPQSLRYYTLLLLGAQVVKSAVESLLEQAKILNPEGSKEDHYSLISSALKEWAESAGPAEPLEEVLQSEVIN